MSPDKRPAPEEEKEVTKEERLEKIKALISDRGEDAASVLKMWLVQRQEGKKK